MLTLLSGLKLGSTHFQRRFIELFKCCLFTDEEGFVDIEILINEIYWQSADRGVSIQRIGFFVHRVLCIGFCA